MEYTLPDFYEVEKIINCKYFKNKKYYLIKWLFYPINQSTWEPKSNLKNLTYLIHEFEASYPFSIDQNMYNIFCKEENKKSVKSKKKNFPTSQKENQFISKKRKIEYFSESELNDHYFDKLKIHLHINEDKNRCERRKQSKDELVIDLSLNNSTIEETSFKNPSLEESNGNLQNPISNSGLKMPILL